MIGIGAVTHVHVHGHAHETGQVANTRSLNTSGGNAAQGLYYHVFSYVIVIEQKSCYFGKRDRV